MMETSSSVPSSNEADAAMASLPAASRVCRQMEFAASVKREMDRLVTSGVQREEAADNILARLLDTPPPAGRRPQSSAPSEEEIVGVMRTHRLSRDEAMRALTVRRAVRVLRSQGWDAATAIEELTTRLLKHPVISSPPPQPRANDCQKQQQDQQHPPRYRTPRGEKAAAASGTKGPHVQKSSSSAGSVSARRNSSASPSPTCMSTRVTRSKRPFSAVDKSTGQEDVAQAQGSGRAVKPCSTGDSAEGGQAKAGGGVGAQAVNVNAGRDGVPSPRKRVCHGVRGGETGVVRSGRRRSSSEAGHDRKSW